MPPAAAFTRTLPALLDTVVPAYAAAGALDFAYAQGSLVEGLAEEGDLDVIAVWSGDVPAGVPGLPAVDELVDGAWRLDRFWLDGQQIDVTHHRRETYDSLLAELERGRGTTGWPTPVVMAHGARHGVVLHDPSGSLAAVKARCARVPARFATATAAQRDSLLGASWPEIEKAAARDDGLLLHHLLVPALRSAWIAWFAARGEWFPHEKRLQARVRRVDPALADLELAVWRSDDVLAAARALLDALRSG